MALAGKEIPIEVVVISARGEKKGGQLPIFKGFSTRPPAESPDHPSPEGGNTP
jgi:hypothetical protein